MSITNISKVFEVNSIEYGFLTKDILPVSTGESIPVTIPKLMGKLEPKGTESLVCSGIFANDKECRPVYEKTVKKLDELLVPVKSNCNMEHLVSTKDNKIPKDTRYLIEFTNKNIGLPRVTTL